MLVLTLILEDLDLAQPKVLLFLPVVPDIDELAGVAVAPVAQEDGLLALKLTLKLGARLVHRLVALKELWKKEEDLGRLNERNPFSSPKLYETYSIGVHIIEKCGLSFAELC